MRNINTCLGKINGSFFNRVEQSNELLFWYNDIGSAKCKIFRKLKKNIISLVVKIYRTLI